MRNKTQRSFLLIFALIIIVTIPAAAVYAEEFGPDILMTGECNMPVMITVASPAYKMISQFGEERTESLNRLMKHLSLSVTIDRNGSETAVMVDDEPVYTYTEQTDNSGVKTVYSLNPDVVYLHKAEDTQQNKTDFTAFLDSDFFRLNKLLDELYPVFEKSAEVFQEYRKESSVTLNFSGYGKGVKRLTIPLPDQYIKDNFPRVLADLAETEDCKTFIQQIHFSGPQKIILMYNENNQLLRINYDGTVGLTEESMRKVSLVWRCVRTNDRKKDHLTLKTPAVQGYDKYNISYERIVDLSVPEKHIIKWDMQLDIKEDKTRKKTEFNADLVLKENMLCGTVQFTEKQDGTENKITVIPALEKENGTEYSGTIEITNKTGKIITSSTICSVRVCRGREVDVQDCISNQETTALTENESDSEEMIRDKLSVALIRRMLLLPSEDITIFSMDIPEDVWNSLVQSLF